jgi:hypothetical protein
MLTNSHAHRVSIQYSATAAPPRIAAASALRGFSRRVQMFASLILAALVLQVPAWGRTEIADAAQPQLFSARDGRIWLAYAKDSELFAAYSSDGGATFSSAVKLAGKEKFMIGMRRGPRIVAEGERVTVTVIGSELLSFHSTDGGRTWSGAHTINEVAGSAREGLHDLTAAPGGRVFVTWLDLRNGKMELAATYDVLLTQRLILQPRLDLNAALQDAPKFGVGSGVNNVEAGLRLRYEIRREFAPYVGVTWIRQLGQTADLSRAAGEPVDDLRFVLGLRLWW